MSAFRLTSYQQSYVDNRLSGMNQIDALRNSLYKTEGRSEASLRVQAHRLENHTNIKLTIEAGRQEVNEKVITLAAFSKEQAFKWAEEDRKKARDLGQIGAANAATRLACDLVGHIIDRKQVEIRDLRDMSDEEIAEQRAALEASFATHRSPDQTTH